MKLPSSELYWYSLHVVFQAKLITYPNLPNKGAGHDSQLRCNALDKKEIMPILVPLNSVGFLKLWGHL